MKNYYTVSLPVKAYIKKYVTTLEGDHIFFDSASQLCQILRAHLCNKPLSGLSRKQMESSVASRNQVLQIKVPLTSKNLRTIGYYIREDNVVLLNRFLEECFETALINFISEYAKGEGRYVGYKDAYYAFAEAYNIKIDEDISFEGLKKIEYRSRTCQAKGMKKKSENLFTLVPSLCNTLNTAYPALKTA